MMLRREIAQEIGNLSLGHSSRMTFTVEENKTADPIEISLLGAQTIATRAHEDAHLLEQFGVARRGGFRLNNHWFLNG